MNEEFRESGIEFLGKIPWGTHISLIYSSMNDLDISVSFIKAGILNNELCVWIYSQNISKEEILSLIALQVENPEEYIKRGQLLVISFDAWYVNDVENFNEVRVSRQWGELVAKAVENGYTGLRAVADTYWLDKCYYRDFSRYESNLGAIISELPFIVICQYNESRIGIGETADIVNNHNYTIIRTSSNRRVITNTELLVKNVQYEALREMERELREGENKLREQAAVLQAVNLVHERAMACDRLQLCSAKAFVSITMHKVFLFQDLALELHKCESFFSQLGYGDPYSRGRAVPWMDHMENEYGARFGAETSLGNLVCVISRSGVSEDVETDRFKSEVIDDFHCYLVVIGGTGTKIDRLPIG